MGPLPSPQGAPGEVGFALSRTAVLCRLGRSGRSSGVEMLQEPVTLTPL